MTPSLIDPAAGSATPLDGYLYQLDVSVWAALELLLATRRAQELVLEPASKEDLETDIEDEPGALVQTIGLGAYRLVLQCKLRTTGPWKIAALMRVLSHGTKRLSAKARLKDPNIRYLLVTNADVDGTARKLITRDLDFWPPALPKEIAQTLPPGAAGRVAILAAMDFERLRFRIETLLKERFRIPLPHVARCLEELRAEALARMRNVGQGHWQRVELDQVLAAHGGYAGDTDALDGFVPPTNWEDMKQALAANHALIIAGPSGTGKTRTGKALVAHLRDLLPGLSVVPIEGGPDKLFCDGHPPPVVYEIEDPWGRFRLEPTSLPWHDSITAVLATARADRKFIITSRSDVLQESGPKKLAQKWLVRLEEENYRSEDRVLLFEQRLPTLPRAYQAIVVPYRKDAVERLITPLEMHRFFDGLAAGTESGEADRAYVERCLAEAQQGSIETAILNNVRARNDWPLAAAVWGLFKSGAKQSFATIPGVQAGLTARDATLEDRLGPYLNFLIAGRNLRQHEEALTYQHPRVELGLEQALLEKPEQSGRVLSYLIDTLVELDDRNATDWGREGAAHIVAAVADLAPVHLKLAAQTQAKLDAWLTSRLLAATSNVEDALRLAARAASKDDIPGELARWLTSYPPKRRRPGWFLEHWTPEPKAEAWYEQVRKHSATKPICEIFIREHLTRARGYYGEGFAAQIGRFADDLAPAFRDAALQIVEAGVHPNDDPIAAGALTDLDGFEPVVTAALAYQAKLHAQPDDGLWLSLMNSKYSEDAAEHYADNDDGYTADVFLKAFVRTLRDKRGWQTVRDHPRARDLVYEWFDALAKVEGVTDDEWVALSKVALNSRYENRYWETLANRPFGQAQTLLAQHLVLGTADTAARLAATELAAGHFAGLFDAVARQLLPEDRSWRVFQIAADLKALARRDRAFAIAPALAALMAPLPAPLAHAVHAIAEPTTPLDPKALPLITALDAHDDANLAFARAQVLLRHGQPVDDVLAALLSGETGDNEDAHTAAVAAITLAIEASAWPVVETTLTHRFADVRERALVALAGRSHGVLPQNLLGLAADKGSGVRKALLKLLQQRRHVEHREALLRLAADDWSPHAGYYGQDRDHPIAVGAAELLADPPPLDAAQIDAITKIVTSTGDTAVAQKLLFALVKNGSIDSRRRVRRFAMRTGRLPLHAFAAEALLDYVGHLEPELADAIPVEQLVDRVSTVAIPLALILGAAATPDHVLCVARTLAAKPTRRALVAVIWLGASARSATTGDDLLQLLPEPFARAWRRAAAGRQKLAGAAWIRWPITGWLKGSANASRCCSSQS